jgi:superfamily II DNA/RNA helicase
MSAFREGRSQILVATNVAARGIDVNNVGLVVNFELPDSPQWLTHRVGRTARMGEAGRALTFVSPEDEVAWVKLGRLGAPVIRELDTKRLLDEGSWHYREGRPMQSVAASSRPRVNGNRGRRWHSGNGSGSGRPSRPRQSA